MMHRSGFEKNLGLLAVARMEKPAAPTQVRASWGLASSRATAALYSHASARLTPPSLYLKIH